MSTENSLQPGIGDCIVVGLRRSLKSDPKIYDLIAVLLLQGRSSKQQSIFR